MNYIEVLREVQLDIQSKLNYLIKNTLNKDNEEIYSIMKNFNDSIIFLLDSKKEIDKHFINQKEPKETLESTEIYNIIDIQNKRIKTCIMEFMHIELKSCEQCNFNQVCDWIKKDNETMNILEKINTEEENEALKNLLELEKADNTRLNIEIQELLRFVNDSIRHISKLQSSPFSEGMTYILLQLRLKIERID